MDGVKSYLWGRRKAVMRTRVQALDWQATPVSLKGPGTCRGRMTELEQMLQRLAIVAAQLGHMGPGSFLWEG